MILRHINFNSQLCTVCIRVSLPLFLSSLGCSAVCGHARRERQKLSVMVVWWGLNVYTLLLLLLLPLSLWVLNIISEIDLFLFPWDISETVILVARVVISRYLSRIIQHSAKWLLIMNHGERNFLGCSQDVFSPHGQDDFCTRDNWQTAVLYLAQVTTLSIMSYRVTLTLFFRRWRCMDCHHPVPRMTGPLTSKPVLTW